jgi:hypothetical protein
MKRAFASVGKRISMAASPLFNAPGLSVVRNSMEESAVQPSSFPPLLNNYEFSPAAE